MAIRKRISGKTKAGVSAVAAQVSDFAYNLSSDPSITRFAIEVDKNAGVVRCNAVGSDGRVVTKSILGPGLEEVVRYDPSKASTAERDANIRQLLGKGLTQTEVATRIGVSQALVSKVYRASE